MKTAKSLRTAAMLQDFVEEPKSNLTRWGKLSIWHEALWYNDALDKRIETTVSIIVVQEIRRIQSVWFWQSSRAAIPVAFAVLVFSDTKSRVINLLLTEFARAVLGEYRPSVFLVRTSPKRLGPYCQDLGPIFSQYGPRTRSIRYIYRTQWAVLCCHPACDYSIQPDFKLNMKEFTKTCDCFVEKRLSFFAGWSDVRCEPISVRSLSLRRNSNGPRPGSCRACRKRIIVLETRCKRVKHPNK